MPTTPTRWRRSPDARSSPSSWSATLPCGPSTRSRPTELTHTPSRSLKLSNFSLITCKNSRSIDLRYGTEKNSSIGTRKFPSLGIEVVLNRLFVIFRNFENFQKNIRTRKFLSLGNLSIFMLIIFEFRRIKSSKYTTYFCLKNAKSWIFCHQGIWKKFFDFLKFWESRFYLNLTIWSISELESYIDALRLWR